jgi:glycogen debranching enzyme
LVWGKSHRSSMQRAYCSRIQRYHSALVAIILVVLASFPSNTWGQTASLELSRPVRSWEFLPVVGTRAGLFGNEAGRFEAWVYPLKLFRNFRLIFHTDGRALPAESLARTVTVHPESCSIVYADDTFQVRETLFVPVKEPGAVITLEVETVQPLEIEAVFQRDFQLEWPAALGGTYLNWELPLRAFYFGEEQKKYAALVGSPTGVLDYEEYDTNYSASEESSFLLGPTAKGKETKLIVIAASMQGLADAQNTYERLLKDYVTLMRDSADYYRKYLDQTVRLELPDAQLQQAYDWARISMLQGLVTNPYLGTGLIAGYRTSGSSQRPGFAWFFGRDALWTSLALDAEGDFATTRTALDFLSQYQRADGKIAHEISQGANFVGWFKDYPYAYASADATPLYIITMNDYVVHSGDVEFAKAKWDSLWKAYQFLKSTYDAQNLPQNFGIGHGWVEGGPLLPVKTELYQSGLGAEALHALGNLAHLAGKEDVSKELEQAFASQKTFLNQIFWSPDKKLFSFALDRNNQRVDMASVLATVPMWFGLLDEPKSETMLNLLADSDHQADWGMRIISSRDPKYNPGGYHFGSVWPLFTGWASVGEYRYHRALPAYSNLRANALLASDGSLGHVTEVLSGDYYQPLSTSSPHQIWSAAMVVSPILRGMLGLDADAFTHEVVFAPHMPYGWSSVHLSNLRLGNCALDLAYRRTADSIVLEAKRSGTGACSLEFSPALSLRASVSGTEINGRPVAVHMEKNSVDQHASVRFPVSSGPNTLHMRVHNDFGLFYSSGLPALGSTSEGMRVVSESWSPAMDALTLDVAGRPGHVYELGVWNPEHVTSVEGSAFEKTSAKVRIQFTGSGEDYVHSKVVFHFGGKHGGAQ